MPFDKGLQLIDGWMQNYSAIKAGYIKRVENLQAVTLSIGNVNALVGDLFTRAVRFNNGERILAPLNQSQVSAMVHKGFDRQVEAGEEITGWDVLNWGTYVLKPHTDDMTGLIQSTAEFNDYIYDALCPSDAAKNTFLLN